MQQCYFFEKKSTEQDYFIQQFKTKNKILCDTLQDGPTQIVNFKQKLSKNAEKDQKV